MPELVTTPAAAASPHHFSLGQLFGLALLGLEAYSQQNQPGSGPGIFLNPAITASYMQGVAAVLSAQYPAPAAQ